jgi:hypothetical protein
MINTRKVVISNILWYARFSNDNMIYKLSNLDAMKVQISLKEPMRLFFKGATGLFLVLFIFSYEMFCNLLLKIHIVTLIYHIFCIGHYWINMIFSKYRFCQVLYFILKNNHIFKSYQNVLTNSDSCSTSYNFVVYVMYITPHLHVVKDSWKFENLKHTSSF